MALLTCRDLALGYNGKRVAEGINFSVNSGDYLCIVGENGSGKTTLMKTILGLKKADSGQVIFGDDLQSREIGYLPQQTMVQKDFPASVMEIVLSDCLNRCGLRPWYSKSDRLLAVSNMSRMEVEDIAGRCYRELSGGQQQRVLLARALCATQKLLLLDEPTAGLDPDGTRKLYEIINRLNKKGINDEKITVIMITHDIDAARKYASHVLHISHSQLFFGTCEEYRRSNVGCGHDGGEIA